MDFKPMYRWNCFLDFREATNRHTVDSEATPLTNPSKIFIYQTPFNLPVKFVLFLQSAIFSFSENVRRNWSRDGQVGIGLFSQLIVLNLVRRNFYRPQRSWGKVMFLQASVILSTGGVPDQVHPPGTRYPPGPGTPPGTRYTPSPRPSTPPPTGTRYTPRDQVHTPPQCRACWEIRSTRRRYASYWNAILFITALFENSCAT